MISQEAVQTILGIKGKVAIQPEEMVKNMQVAFYPVSKPVSENIQKAQKLLRDKLIEFGVEELSYDTVFIKVGLYKRIRKFIRLVANDILYIGNLVTGNKNKRFFIDFKTIRSLSAGYKYKPGVCIVVSGTLDTEDLPMQYIRSFKDNSIITILDFPEQIDEQSTFEHHFDASMTLFAHHMANIVLAVDESRWMIYNFNASHPIFDFHDGEKLDYYILNGLIPKVVAPISPHRMKDFTVLKKRFDVDTYHDLIEDLSEGAKLYAETNLFPAGKKIDDLKFRNNFHRQIGKLHLDSRNGMSFGFIAKQLPLRLPQARFLTYEEKEELYSDLKDYRIAKSGEMYIVCTVNNFLIEVEVPEVWVMTLRSGSDKTHFNKEHDLLKMGLEHGEMFIQVPLKTVVDSGYKPSFDTKVILAHAVGNAVNAGIAHLLGVHTEYVHTMQKEGCSISHWHGYFKEDMLPPHVSQYGKENPHVACSSPQSAVYALHGKLDNFRKVIEKGEKYFGDIHVEPHHGSNICYPKLVDLVTYILDNKESVSLGNKYL